MTMKELIELLGEFGEVSDDIVVSYLKDNQCGEVLIANAFGYYHIADEKYVDENGNWLV